MTRICFGLSDWRMLLQRLGEDIQRIGNGRLEDGALAGELHVAAGALEQADADLVLQLLDLMADGCRRHVQLLRGAGEAQVAGSGVKGLDGLQSGNVAQHGQSSNSV